MSSANTPQLFGGSQGDAFSTLQDGLRAFDEVFKQGRTPDRYASTRRRSANPLPQMMDTEELKAPLSELTRALSGLTPRLVAVEETNRASAGQMAAHAGLLQGWLALSSAFVS